jgi:hypothetical protein
MGEFRTSALSDEHSEVNKTQIKKEYLKYSTSSVVPQV